MRRVRNWKHNTKDPKRYGKRNTEKYDTPFMKLDEEIFKGKEDEE
jgi:hypothetical protein